MLDIHDQLAVIEGLRAGRADAWAMLYDGYSLDVWRMVARLLGSDSAGVADVIQEAFLEAARSAKQFDASRGTLWSWLCGIARHKVSAHWRETKRVNRLRQKLEAHCNQLAVGIGDDAQPDELALSQELTELVRYTLAELPSDYAALLTAKYIDDKSLDELSRQWGSSVDATKSKLARARREFRERFNPFHEQRKSTT